MHEAHERKRRLPPRRCLCLPSTVNHLQQTPVSGANGTEGAGFRAAGGRVYGFGPVESGGRVSNAWESAQQYGITAGNCG